ncbi:hypothetical protein F5B20DRAFT_223445 [Whalleya microplaca]|nr:hypothetical protein F5B20DRAFT_223445 [Whalleya microplaca]
MPLHLLGKKSWNVYNTANIERVRRDEAAAAAREEAEEQRQQDADAARRLALLRGEEPPPLSPPRPTDDDATRSGSGKRDRDEQWTSRGEPRKRRKRAGEDDTDFEVRLARERVASAAGHSDGAVVKSSDAPLVDSAGHIDLFPQGSSTTKDEKRAPHKHEKNAEAEKEAAAKRREFEDQYTMRFANAAGRDKDGLVAGGVWYAKGGEVVDAHLDAPGKDVWGNEDPRHKDREAKRVVASDPLAMMKRGAARIREVERERRLVNEEKERELKELRREERRRRRREGGENDGLEGFSLDGQASGNRSDRKHRSRDDDNEHRRRRHRESRDDKERHRHRSEHRHHHHHDSHHRRSRTEHGDRDRHSTEHSRQKAVETK